MKIGLILTNDWEVFGDGSGDYRRVQHQPLEECLSVVANYGAKMTVMAEVGQQIWGFKKLGAREPWAADIAAAWEEIMRETIRQGSDVQLHLHPQWLDARYAEGKWALNLDKWAIGRVDPAEAKSALATGRDYLEELLKPIDASYRCHAFRAGAYCIQPSGRVIAILRELGFDCDTSVTKGYIDQGFYDYTDAESNMLPWHVDTDVRYRSASGNGLLELPIYSFKMLDSFGLRAVLGGSRTKNLLYKLNYGVPYLERDRQWFKERDRIRAELYPAENRPYQTPMHKLKGLLSSPRGWLSLGLWPVDVQLDYDYLPPNVFVEGVERIFTSRWGKEHGNDDVILPVVASGHVKNMHNGENLDRILESMRAAFGDRLVHWTITDAVNDWMSRSPAVGATAV